MWLNFTVILLLFSGLHAFGHGGDPYQLIYNGYDAYISRKCLKNAGSDAYDDLQKAVRVSPGEQSPGRKQSASGHVYTLICSGAPKIFYPYLENIMNKLSVCIDSEAKFLSSFILNVFNDTITQRCQPGEEIFIARLDAIHDVKCDVPPTKVPTMVGHVCAPKMILFENGTEIDPDFVVTKKYFCEELRNIAECITRTLKERCDSDKLSKYVGTFMEPSIELCKND